VASHRGWSKCYLHRCSPSVVVVLVEEHDLAVGVEDGAAIHTHTLLGVGMATHLTSSRRRRTGGGMRNAFPLPDRSRRSCLSLCDVAYSYSIFGLVHYLISDLSCSVLRWYRCHVILACFFVVRFARTTRTVPVLLSACRLAGEITISG